MLCTDSSAAPLSLAAPGIFLSEAADFPPCCVSNPSLSLEFLFITSPRSSLEIPFLLLLYFVLWLCSNVSEGLPSATSSFSSALLLLPLIDDLHQPLKLLV